MAFSCEFAPQVDDLLEAGPGRGRRRQRGIEELSDGLLSAYQMELPSRTAAKAGTPFRESDWMRAARRRGDDFHRERQFRRYLHAYLAAHSRTLEGRVSRQSIGWVLGIDLCDGDRKFEVHAIRPTMRVRRDGRTKTELLVMITQRESRKLRLSAGSEALKYFFRGGCTLLIDPELGEVRYAITKDISSASRRERHEQFLREQLEREGLEAKGHFGVWERGQRHQPVREPFGYCMPAAKVAGIRTGK